MSEPGTSAALRSLALKIQGLEDQVARQAQGAAAGAVAGGSGGAGDGSGGVGSQQQVLALETKVGEYGKVLQAMRNRIVALQVGRVDFLNHHTVCLAIVLTRMITRAFRAVRP